MATYILNGAVEGTKYYTKNKYYKYIPYFIWSNFFCFVSLMLLGGNEMNEMLLYMRYFFIFVAGVIIGRLTMAIQYALMKPRKHDVTANMQKEDKKAILSKEADKFYTPGATISIIKPLSSIDLKNKF